MRGLAESMGQCSSFRRHCAIQPSRSKSAVRDDAKPDDVDTDQEDHCGDACRYACNSTPRVATEGRFIIG